MPSLTNDNLTVFNRPDRVVEGWYWAMPSSQLGRSQAQPLSLMGKELVLYRTDDGVAVALDAHCKHRGAHLALGKVEGTCIKCPYHRWKYDDKGCLVDVPVMDEAPAGIRLGHWPVEEKYGLIWVYTAKTARHPVITVPELEGVEADWSVGSQYKQNCHPNIVMSDAIDVQHFESVHHIGYLLDMEYEVVDANRMVFKNTRHAPKDSRIGRFLRMFYKGPVTYSLNYWNGAMGTVTLGPDFLHFHTLFANRLGPDGTSEGQIVLITKARRGPIGWLFNRVSLFLGKIVVGYFGVGDTPNFNMINANFQNPVKADKQLIAFMQQVEKMKLSEWGWGKLPDSQPPLELADKLAG